MENNTYYHIHKSNMYDKLYESGKVTVGKIPNYVGINVKTYDDFTDENLLGLMKTMPYVKEDIFKAYIERVLERVRPTGMGIPSRLYSIFLCDENDLGYWENILTEKDKPLYIYKVKTSHKPFVALDSLMPRETDSSKEIMRKIMNYWHPSSYDVETQNKKEYLYTGELEIVERVK